MQQLAKNVHTMHRSWLVENDYCESIANRFSGWVNLKFDFTDSANPSF